MFFSVAIFFCLDLKPKTGPDLDAGCTCKIWKSVMLKVSDSSVSIIVALINGQGIKNPLVFPWSLAVPRVAFWLIFPRFLILNRLPAPSKYFAFESGPVITINITIHYFQYFLAMKCFRVQNLDCRSA